MAARRELVDYVAVSAGMALGASCFAVTGGLFGIVAGPQVLIAVTLAGAMCLVASSSVADLARRYPSAPGIRTYLKDTVGDRASLVLLFMYLAMAVLAVGIESHVLSRLAQALFPSVNPLLAIALPLLFVVAANLAGLEPSQGVQTTLTGLLIAGMLLLCGAAVVMIVGAGAAAWPVAATGGAAWSGLPEAVGVAIFLYVGFEWVTPVGRSPRAYQRLIPLSMVIGVLVLWLVYGLFVVALWGRLDRAAVAASSIPHVLLARTVFGSDTVNLVIVLSLLAMLTTVNAGLMGASRLIYAVSREGYLPRWCSRLSLRTAAPVAAILVLGAAGLLSSLLVARTGAYLLVAKVCASINCLVYAALVAASLRIQGSKTQHTLAVRVVRCVIAAVMIALGVAAMVGPVAAPAGFFALAVICGVLAEWSLSLGKRQRSAAGQLVVESP